MLDSKTKLIVKHVSDGTFIDYSDKCQDLLRDSFVLGAFDQTDDSLYIGYEKPINALYVEMLVPDAYETELSLKYFNGSTWEDTSTLSDETIGFSRSGFIQWERNQLHETATTVDSVEAFWYKINVAQTLHSTTSLYGISLLFSDDQCLLEEFPRITDDSFYVNQSDKRHTYSHVAVRNEIIQKFRNKDYFIIGHDGVQRPINHWDLLNIDEVKQGAKYLVLSKIFLNASDSSEDNYAQKSALYHAQGQEALQLIRLSTDVQDNGLKQTSSYAQVKTSRMTR